jgi:hypothetical protein
LAIGTAQSPSHPTDVNAPSLLSKSISKETKALLDGAPFRQTNCDGCTVAFVPSTTEAAPPSMSLETSEPGHAVPLPQLAAARNAIARRSFIESFYR